MISLAHNICDFRQLGRLGTTSRPLCQPEIDSPLYQFSPARRRSRFNYAGISCDLTGNADTSPEPSQRISGRRREFVLVPIIVTASGLLSSLATAKAEEQVPNSPASVDAVVEEKMEKEKEKDKTEEGDGSAMSRVYDATVIGEPQAVGKDRKKVWERLLAARIVYLGEAEQVPDRDDRILELEIVRNLFSRCSEQQRSLSLAIEAFPCDLQEQLNQFMEGRIDGAALRSYTSHWPPERWQEYAPLLNYCLDNGVKLVACGTPLEVLRTVQAEGIRGLTGAQRKLYAPPAGSGFISGFTSISGRSLLDQLSSKQSVPFGPYSYLSAQAKVVDDYSVSQIIMQAVIDGGSTGLLVVVTGVSHVIYGSRGMGVPARISRKLQKKNQVVILLDPERQQIRREGEVPVADFLWYSAAKSCSRNCFDRAEIARVMNAAGRRREALPQDLQKGLDLGVVSPEILQNFFDLEQYPIIAELLHRFQGFRERLLADPKFLNRLAIEETISVTTTLLAQYERRKGRFFEEIDYVLTDTIRGIVVDFFTVWLPAPTLSFLSQIQDSSPLDKLELLQGFLGSLPDNAFQKSMVGKDWNVNQRLASVLFGGLKLASVGFISSVGAGAASDVLYAIRQYLNGTFITDGNRKRTPILKSAIVYSCFLGTSANLRYQQWIDLARYSGLQPRKNDGSPIKVSESTEPPLLECSSTNAETVDENSNKSEWIKGDAKPLSVLNH
ncbi:protein RETICULATA-RELATED 6, chloroplastic-like isoform X2 [Phalaenopsis equestris]|uniref:protein RETICULATA-RELATED 6, chloroplastic-like isoform X2 n=1 Tax=Phalaenopsis equestris TaxID=78828 RepID=UPI0009E254C2|nr:protein RETICULATA-RELATED 6, chloroplastic-like isoform X2 [Phalaenopsis equestris]